MVPINFVKREVQRFEGMKGDESTDSVADVEVGAKGGSSVFSHQAAVPGQELSHGGEFPFQLGLGARSKQRRGRTAELSTYGRDTE